MFDYDWLWSHTFAFRVHRSSSAEFWLKITKSYVLNKKKWSQWFWVGSKNPNNLLWNNTKIWIGLIKPVMLATKMQIQSIYSIFFQIKHAKLEKNCFELEIASRKFHSSRFSEWSLLPELFISKRTIVYIHRVAKFLTHEQTIYLFISFPTLQQFYQEQKPLK